MIKHRATTGIHGMDFYIDSGTHSRFSGNFVTVDLNPLLFRLFAMELKNFKRGSENQAHDFRFKESYTYKNQIMIYADGFGFNKGKVKFTLHGSAFDDGLVDPIELRKILKEFKSTVSEFHVFADDDGDILKFDKLWKSILNRKYTSDYTCKPWQGKTVEAGSSINFGSTAAKYLQIYEKGKKDPHCYPREHVRCEIQFAHKQAQQAAQEWIGGKDLGTLAREHIAGMVQFKDPRNKDKNASRIKELDPMWERYLAGVEEVRFSLTKSGSKNVEAQLKAILAGYKRHGVEHGPDVVTALFLQAMEDLDGNGFDTSAANKQIQRYVDFKKNMDTTTEPNIIF